MAEPDQAIREMRPLYEEHVKMFAPLGVRAGHQAGPGRGCGEAGRLGAAGVPTLEHFMQLGAWFRARHTR